MESHQSNLFTRATNRTSKCFAQMIPKAGIRLRMRLRRVLFLVLALGHMAPAFSGEARLSRAPQ
jgi:hypothetical protein